MYMPPIYIYEWPGEDGGTWYAAQYPLGATRYYATEAARQAAVDAYRAAVGGTTLVIDNQQR